MIESLVRILDKIESNRFIKNKKIRPDNESGLKQVS
ncbi:hypothetical protein PbB2_02335 [Candidatus Phycosocius bacilliformis]|uniref:Uncharacterized protein n=1 Tax=Candidatus Phycosocius bacilliformis TaxID=1445552 RepID=A0A2P2EC46_9PROT|nr:hypothetical protein PbB2_02335 [Candidatus Phycosocius bacilliformis]